MKNGISERFNTVGSRTATDALNKWSVGGALVVGVVLLPFSTTFALAAMAMPTIYFGAGLALQGAARLMGAEAPKPPSTH